MHLPKLYHHSLGAYAPAQCNVICVCTNIIKTSLWKFVILKCTIYTSFHPLRLNNKCGCVDVAAKLRQIKIIYISSTAQQCSWKKNFRQRLWNANKMDDASRGSRYLCTTLHHRSRLNQINFPFSLALDVRHSRSCHCKKIGAANLC